jgi:hypothetical protein
LSACDEQKVLAYLGLQEQSPENVREARSACA